MQLSTEKQQSLETEMRGLMTVTEATLGTDRDARDWTGFFAALASFMATILPLIAPLFLQPPPSKN